MTEMQMKAGSEVEARIQEYPLADSEPCEQSDAPHLHGWAFWAF